MVSCNLFLEHRGEPDNSVPAAISLDELRGIEVVDTDTEETYDLLSTACLTGHSGETNTVRGHSLVFSVNPADTVNFRNVEPDYFKAAAGCVRGSRRRSGV